MSKSVATIRRGVFALIFAGFASAPRAEEDVSRRMLDLFLQASAKREAYSCKFEMQDSNAAETKASGEILWVAPVRFRMKTRTDLPSPSESFLVSDGRSAFHTVRNGTAGRLEVREEKLEAGAQDREAIWERLAKGAEPLPPHAALVSYTDVYDLKLLDDEPELDGQKMHLFEGTYRKGALKEIMLKKGGSLEQGSRQTGLHFNPDEIEAAFGSMKLWIGQDDLMIHKAEQTVPVAKNAPASAKPAKSLRRYFEINLKPEIKDGDFRYTPPTPENPVKSK